MAEKNIQIRTHNGVDWDSLYPKTKADIVQTNDGSTVESKLITINNNLSNKVEQSDIDSAVSNKVDKVSGKGLSTNDFTDTHLQKLQSLENVEVSTDEPTNGSIWFEEI